MLRFRGRFALAGEDDATPSQHFFELESRNVALDHESGGSRLDPSHQICRCLVYVINIQVNLLRVGIFFHIILSSLVVSRSLLHRSFFTDLIMFIVTFLVYLLFLRIFFDLFNNLERRHQNLFLFLRTLLKQIYISRWLLFLFFLFFDLILHIILLVCRNYKRRAVLLFKTARMKVLFLLLFL